MDRDKEETVLSFGVILHEPEQPGNTGAIGRTCICAGASLHLIRPLGFLTDEKSVRRAGLDYWPRLGVREYENMDDFLRQHPGARIWYLTTKAPGRDPGGSPRPLRADPDGGRGTLAESLQRRRHRPV